MTDRSSTSLAGLTKASSSIRLLTVSVSTTQGYRDTFAWTPSVNWGYFSSASPHYFPVPRVRRAQGRAPRLPSIELLHNFSAVWSWLEISWKVSPPGLSNPQPIYITQSELKRSRSAWNWIMGCEVQTIKPGIWHLGLFDSWGRWF